MTIYFTASILQKDALGKYYSQIVEILESMGHKVIHEHVTQKSLKNLDDLSEEQNGKYFQQVQKWISESDVIVAEVSFPSTLNIGHQVAMALEKGKSVICLYHQDRISRFFEAIKSDKLIYEEYTGSSLDHILKQSIDLALDTSDVRFNFIISPSLLEYLDWIAKNKKLPRSVYLRRLIEEDMAKNKGYKN